jgi:DNA-binding transcriptional regulator LsrR (DeoR family)
MHSVARKGEIRVVQILGGVGDPSAKVHANRLTSRFADLVGGTPVYLPAPGVLDSAAARAVLLADAYVRDVISLFDEVSTALVGIGAIEPSKLLAASGNIFPAHELELLRNKGAVGDVLLRFFDGWGKPVSTSLNERVVSMRLDQLAKVDRSIGVAGGARKYAAILGALRGGWINVLITDQFTARRLLTEADT